MLVFIIWIEKGRIYLRRERNHPLIQRIRLKKLNLNFSEALPNPEERKLAGYKNESGRKLEFLFPICDDDFYHDDSIDENIPENEQFVIHRQSSKTEVSGEMCAQKSVEEKMSEENNEKTPLEIFCERATKNDDDQIVVLADETTTANKIQFPETQQKITLFPAFILITNEDKGKINKKRFILRNMLNPYCREKSKKQLISMAKQIKHPRSLDYFQFKNEEKDKCIQFYTMSSFYSYSLNIGLKAFSSPEEYSYLRLIFSDLFIQILNKYQREEHGQFPCWRGTMMSKTEIIKLKRSIGNYIELQGFISTSKKQQAARQFSGNVFIKIIVPAKQLSNSQDEIIDYGYADISQQSQFEGQGEVLFNAINCFFVTDVKEAKNQKYDWFVELRYCRLSQIRGKNQNAKENELWKNYCYQQQKIRKIRNQGQCFFQCGEYQNCKDWFGQKLEQIQYNFSSKFGQEINSQQIDSETKEKQSYYKEYAQALFMRASCLNNLEKYEQAERQISQCQKFYRLLIAEIAEKDENYYFIQKAKGNILLNHNQRQKGSKILKKLLKQAESGNWKNVNMRNKFRDEIIMTLKYWIDYSNLDLEEEHKMKLQSLQKTKGKNNVFYQTLLKNRLIFLYERGKYQEIIEVYKKQNLGNSRNSIFFSYVVCLSHFQLGDMKEVEKLFQCFKKAFKRENEQNIKIKCTEVNMFLHLICTFYDESKSSKYLHSVHDLLEFQCCYAERQEHLTEFKFWRQKLVLLGNSSKLVSQIQKFSVLVSYNEML